MHTDGPIIQRRLFHPLIYVMLSHIHVISFHNTSQTEGIEYLENRKMVSSEVYSLNRNTN